MPLTPRAPVPALAVDTLAHGRFDIAAARPERMTLIAFYRGLHCPICITQLKELERLVPDFAARGVELIAISSDDEDRARQMAERAGVSALRLGYGLDLATARAWGLYISAGRGTTSIGIEEPALFSEPGLFLVRADGTLYYMAIQTMPFARPPAKELLAALDFVIKADYPARGEYQGAL
ncbi:peroxiredoxin-like family protein [Tistrella mobilis]|mgnify:FL=1|uniref:Alkyl hydroperoxide reductase/thiol specific antioxidant/Mal allergen n=1 Tax=Tistrella mobilis (strain KA081020-065) TaxID=1110502 RepID=I3TT38_TISMK|nr:peroxiredoxin-like family protein [Tistrella mobilis]AFK55926.1 alkyl hydroperoxide reductase/thiol specific antioxidant/Mal allergen [Tistrella mobilis KA081020-065]MAM76874.1 alkyl hydroperoxide reductase [Tistrella sp.]